MVFIKLKTFILSTFIIFIFTLIACTNKLDLEDASFEGESQNWRVVLEIERLETAGSDRSYTISYIGEGPKPETFTYEIEPGTPFSTRSEGSLKGQDEMSIFFGGDTAPVHKNMPFEVNIEWEGKSEDVLIKIK